MGHPNLGELGEQVTAKWLQTQGWQIIASRWRCRWGELDLVAYYPATMETQLTFVEVKTRQAHNWDEDGLLAITPQKQQKLFRTAKLFLAMSPRWADTNCRFDLALVKARSLTVPTTKEDTLSTSIQLNYPISYQGYELTLTTYLENIF